MGIQMSLFDSPKKVEKAYLLIDGNNLLHRCYYATAHANLRRTSDGVYTNAVFLFLKMMARYKTELNAHVAVAFDEGKGFRKELYDAYKEGRSETPDQLKSQFPIIKEILEAIGVPVYSDAQYEADDLLASLAEKVSEPVYILTNDRDLLQAVSEQVTVIVRKGKDDLYITPERFKVLYSGLTPKQIVDYKAIVGDSSDNIPGIQGIGEKGAIALLNTFGKIESMIDSIGSFPKEVKRYENKVEKGKESAILAKKLTTLHRNVDIQPKNIDFNKEQWEDYCVKYEMSTLLGIEL